MSTDVELLRVAERAADWLVRLDAASPQQLAEFWRWLTESPLHVQEMLAAQACQVELSRLLKDRKAVSGLRRSVSDEELIESGEDESPQILGNALLKALQILAASPQKGFGH